MAPDHFTYVSPEGDLHQGDLVRRTPEIDKLLEDVHHHYTKEDYRYFLVLTQSCDLVRRNIDACKARYITLAAVRPLGTVVDRVLEKHQRSPREGRLRLARASDQPHLRRFLEGLLNNNADGYFYLHSDVSCSLPDPMVAFLALSVAVKADLHYQTCLDARVVQLQPEFQAKLGWLVGNMYSRVGTEDWTPGTDSPEEFQERVSNIVDELGVFWLDDRDLNKIKKADRKKEEAEGGPHLTQEEVVSLVEEITAEKASRREQAAQVVLNLVREADEDQSISEELLNRLRVMLMSEGKLTQFIK